MRDRNHPLKQIPNRVFSIIQAFKEDFNKDLSDVPARYPDGKIVYLSQHATVPLMMVRDEYFTQIGYRTAPTIEDLIHAMEESEAPIIFIQYTPAWFEIENLIRISMFINACRNRARRKGPVVMLATYSVEIPQILKEKSDHFTQVYPYRITGKQLALKEQTRIDKIPESSSGPGPGSKLYGQVKLGV